MHALCHATVMLTTSTTAALSVTHAVGADESLTELSLCRRWAEHADSGSDTFPIIGHMHIGTCRLIVICTGMAAHGQVAVCKFCSPVLELWGVLQELQARVGEQYASHHGLEVLLADMVHPLLSQDVKQPHYGLTLPMCKVHVKRHQ